MRKTVLTFGLIAGAILSAMLLLTIPLLDQISVGVGMVIGYTTMVLSFLLIYFGVRTYRDGPLGGSISFGRALGAGALIVVVASVCYTATWEVIYFKLVPRYRDRMMAEMIKQSEAKGGTPAQIEARLAESRQWAERYQNPLVNSAITFMEPLPVGLVVALVTAGILRRRKQGADTQAFARAAAAS